MSNNIEIYTRITEGGAIWSGFASYVLGIGTTNFKFELGFKLQDVPNNTPITAMAIRRKFNDNWSLWKEFSMVE